MIKTKNIIQNLLISITIIIGLFISYHLLKKILGGSLSVEDIILGLVIFNVSSTFAIVYNLAKLSSDHSHLKRQFYGLAKDFKDNLTNDSN